MRKHKLNSTFLGGLVVHILLGSLVIAQENFEDADKSNDFISADGHPQFDLRHTIPGEPEIDYPIYSAVPKTSFECTGRHEGYYADIESRCQAFRICTHTARRKQGFGFLCPNGTLFSQKNFVCDWYRNVNCDDSEQYYNRNDANRIGSNYDMMETVRQMMEYPMKTISKALQQGASSVRRPPQRQQNLSKEIRNGIALAAEAANNPVQTTSSKKTAVTRAQIESAYKYTKTQTDVQIKSQETVNNKELASSSSSAKESQRSTATKEGVYVNSLGELSTDPGVNFDRTNAHIIAEYPRAYRYEKNMNFAEKVNVGLNNLAELPTNDPIAPDYVKNMRKPQGGSTAHIDLASNINGLLEEVANDLDTTQSGYTVPSPQKSRHAFRFLSRGFTSQGKSNDKYAYVKPKQTASTIRFTPNEISIEPTKNNKDKSTSIQNIHDHTDINTKTNTTDEDIHFTLMTTTPQAPITEESFQSSPTFSPAVDDASYLSPPNAEPLIAPPNESFNFSGINELDEQGTATTLAPLLGEVPGTTDIPELSLNPTYPPYFDNSTNENLAQDVNITAEKPSSLNTASSDLDESSEKLDVNLKAADLLLAGINLAKNEENSLQQVLDVNQTQDIDPLFIRVQDESTADDKQVTTSTSIPITTSITTTTTTEKSTNVIDNVSERLYNSRRLVTFQRATVKPINYTRRTSMRSSTKSFTKSFTKSSTTSKPSTTTRSYLKRVAASRLRLSRFATSKLNGSISDNTVAPLNSQSNLVPTTESETTESKGTLTATNLNDVNEISPNGVTWESVRNNLQRFMVNNRKRSDNSGYTYTTIATSTTTASPRTLATRPRSRYANFKPQTTRSSFNSNKITHATRNPTHRRTPQAPQTTQTSLSSTSSFTSSLSNHRQVPVPSLSNILNSITSSLTSSTIIPTSSSVSAKHTPANLNSLPNTNTKTVSESVTGSSDNFIPFEKLTRSITDDSLLQNYKSSQGTAKTLPAYQVSAVGAEVVNSRSSNQRPSSTVTAPSQLTVPQRSQLQYALPTVTTMAQGQRTPQIVIARAEGQKLEPNSVTSAISSLVTQSPYKKAQQTPYVPLDSFLTKKFGAVVPTSSAITTNGQSVSTYTQQPTYQQRQFQVQAQAQQQQNQKTQQHLNHITQQYLSTRQSAQPQQPQYQQQQQQYQQPARQSYQVQLQPQANQQQQYGQQLHVQQQQQYQQQIYAQQQQQQQQQQNLQQFKQHLQEIHQTQVLPHQQQHAYYQAPVKEQTVYLPPPTQLQQETQSHHSHTVNFLSQNSHAQVPKTSSTAVHPIQQNQFISQSIVADLREQQSQLPPFPPLITAAAQQPQQSARSFAPLASGPSNGYLNIQLPALGASGLIPAPTTQVAQKRIDTIATAPQLELAPDLPFHYTGANSYEVPLSSIGRLPNDITQLLRRLRKF